MDCYCRIMSLLESAKLKATGTSKFRKALFQANYSVISKLENIILRLTPWSNCFLAGYTRHDKKIRVSLTTFPARIGQVAYSIKSLMLQSHRPHSIVLWLAADQFPDRKLPKTLERLMTKGLEIRYCDDLKSHKKYYYSLQAQQPEELVITVDDDIIYHPHTIARLIQSHKESPDAIICSLAHIITFDDEGKINPYSKWLTTGDNADANPNNMPLTGSGCLYPYGVLRDETFDIETIKAVAPTADDLWIGSMSKMSGVRIITPRKVPKTFTVVSSSQTEHLGKINCIGNENDNTMRRLLERYPSFLNGLKR